MRKVDAPPAGWYPDPENRTRLRWWDGLDWTDIQRAPPSDAERSIGESQADFERAHRLSSSATSPPSTPGGLSRADAQEIIGEVRNVARSEVDRAVELFGQRAQAAARSITPLVTDYSNRVFRWVKIALGIAFVLLIAWFVFQVIVQQSFLDWLGDRIDNITDENSAPLVAIGWPR